MTWHDILQDRKYPSKLMELSKKRNSTPLMESVGSLLYLQESTSGFCLEPYETGPLLQIHILLLERKHYNYPEETILAVLNQFLFSTGKEI
jgi:hypothetical protein